MKRTVTTMSQWFVIRENSLLDFTNALNEYVQLGWIPHPESYQMANSLNTLHYSILMEKVLEYP